MHARAVERSKARIEDALARGARRLVGEAAMPGPLFLAPTLLVDVHQWVARKLEALRCHRTQIGSDNPFRHITDEQARQLLGVEHFRRSPLEAGWDSVLEQLGEGVAR